MLALAALAWLALVASLYYVGHKPFSPELAQSFTRALGQTAAAFALVSVAGGLGRWLLKPALHPLSALALQAAIGFGLLSIGTLVFGAAAGVHPLLVWACLILLGVFLRKQIVGWWHAWEDILVLWRESGRLGKLVACGSGSILLSTWAIAAAPPLKFDALVYHLSLPEAYLQAGRIVYLPENMFWGMPQLVEMLYTWAMALAGRETAVLLGWVAGAVALAGMVGLLASWQGTRAAWVSIAALLSGYSLAASLAWGYTDWFAFLFGLGFLAALNLWCSQDGDPGQLALAGAFAGLALGTKYTAGILLLIGSGVIVWRLRRASYREILAAGLRFAIPALVVSAPWWVKNVLATGNPFYPFFFPSGAMSAFRLSFYSIPTWGGWQDVLFLPWRATLSGVEGAVGYSASLGPLLLALAPLAWIGWIHRTTYERAYLRTAALAGTLGLLTWGVAARTSGYLIQSRLYWAIFPALACLAGFGFKALDDLRFPRLRIGRVAAGLILVIFAFSALQVGAGALALGAPQLLLSIKTRDQYLEENQGWYARAMEAVRGLPEGSRVLMLWEPRSLYCRPRCQPDEVLDRWLTELHDRRTPETILQSWREAGYTHLLFYKLGADYIKEEDPRYFSSDWQALAGLLDRLADPVRLGESYLLYSLTP